VLQYCQKALKNTHITDYFESENQVFTEKTTNSLFESGYFARISGDRPPDPDGKEQTPSQRRLTNNFSEISKASNTGGQLIKNNTVVVVTRNYYEGIDIGGADYYKDNLSIRVLGNELNNIQVQSTPDFIPRYGPDDAPRNISHHDAKIGVSGATNPLIQDTILIERDNFLHGPAEDNGRPFSGGCTVTRTKADEREVMNILRNDLGFTNNDTVEWRYETNAGRIHGNLE
jgi:hypothetical protein